MSIVTVKAVNHGGRGGSELAPIGWISSKVEIVTNARISPTSLIDASEACHRSEWFKHHPRLPDRSLTPIEGDRQRGSGRDEGSRHIPSPPPLRVKCDDLNAASRAAARRLGFSYEGTTRQATVYKGRSRDTAWYSIIDSEWPALRGAFEAWLDPGNFDSAGRQRSRLSDLTCVLSRMPERVDARG
jgi:hypothetical protein